MDNSVKLAHSFLLSNEECEVDSDIPPLDSIITPKARVKQIGRSPCVSSKTQQNQTQSQSLPSKGKERLFQEDISREFSLQGPTRNEGLEEGLDKIFQQSFVPHLERRASRSSSSSVTLNKKLIEKLLLRIDDLENRVEDLSGRGDSQTQKSASSSQSSKSSSTLDVSMRYRVLSPPSSITGGVSAMSEEDGHSGEGERRRSRHDSDIIESLSSKIETNHEHLARLDHVVTMQEETIRRQQETLQSMLKNPTILLTAPLKIINFMRMVVAKRKVERVREFKKKSTSVVLIQRFAKGWVVRRRLENLKMKGVRIQAVVRAWRLTRDFKRHRAAAKSIQKVARGNSVRRPQRLRLHYLRSIESLAMLKDAKEKLDKSELGEYIAKRQLRSSITHQPVAPRSLPNHEGGRPRPAGVFSRRLHVRALGNLHMDREE